MNKYTNATSNYDKIPAVKVEARYANDCFAGWDNITQELHRTVRIKGGQKTILVIECYQGVDDAEVLGALTALNPTQIFHSADAMLPAEKISERT